MRADTIRRKDRDSDGDNGVVSARSAVVNEELLHVHSGTKGEKGRRLIELQISRPVLSVLLGSRL